MRAMGELRGYSRTALVHAEDLIQHTGSGQLFALVDPDQGTLEVSSTEKSKELCLWLYTEVRLLAESCGDGQPYVRTTAADILEYLDRIDETVLFAINISHPAGARFPELDEHALEPMDYLADDIAEEPLVWIPTRPVQAGDRRATVELHGTRPGENLLLAFESPEHAQAACGPYQALSAVYSNRIGSIAQECGAQQVVYNGWLADDARHTAPVRDWSRKSPDRQFGR